ncbi:MAG: CHAD domain-containing protein [Acidobacteria bacterium]|nr:CHAD domain-containing protein [Acidobacteriota bacterium]
MSKPFKVRKVSLDDPVHITAVKILRTRLKEFYSHWPAIELLPTEEQLHNLRISGKRLRYSAEQLRNSFPGRLALLIELLKRSQDLLGDFQDKVTQCKVIEIELARIKRRKPESREISVLEQLSEEYRKRQSLLFDQFREIWTGMVLPEFRAGLKAMISAKNSSAEPKTAFQPTCWANMMSGVPAPTSPTKEQST